MAKKKTETDAQTSAPMVEKDINAELKRLQQRVADKDKEMLAMEQELTDKNGHLQFMVNALEGDKARLVNKVTKLTELSERLSRENEYFLKKLDGRHFTFKERIKILFTGRLNGNN